MGNRYFKVDWENGSCIQIVLEKGDKKHAVHCVGIQHLAMASFRGTYHWKIGSRFTSFKYTTENQFKIAYRTALEKFNI
jgi:hypothetical protein